MSSRAQGQITLVDYNDAVTLTGFIESNQVKTQMYNPDNATYTPSWDDTNLVLTPSLFILGSTADKIASTDVTSVKWYLNDSTTPITSAGAYTLSGAKSHILTIGENIMDGEVGADFRCEVSYLDPTTELSLIHIMVISFSKVINGGGITDLIVSTPDGNVFKNNEVSTLTAKAELWRGSTIDTTSVVYQWYKANASQSTDVGGGVGWEKLVSATGGYQGTISATLTVPADLVDSYATYKCIAKDTDATSATYNKNFIDTASFIDNSDPLQVVVTSTGGNVFKNGAGSTTLTAVVYQRGNIIDTDGDGIYTWTKYDENGDVDTNWGTNGSKIGKTLTVGSSDVETKATFMCAVSL